MVICGPWLSELVPVILIEVHYAMIGKSCSLTDLSRNMDVSSRSSSRSSSNGWLVHLSFCRSMEAMSFSFSGYLISSASLLTLDLQCSRLGLNLLLSGALFSSG